MIIEYFNCPCTKPLTVSPDGQSYYVLGGHLSEADSWVRAVAKVPKAEFQKAFDHYCSSVAMYHDSINCFAGVGDLVFTNLRKTGETTYLALDDADYLNKTPCVVYEWTQESEACAEVEHG